MRLAEQPSARPAIRHTGPGISPCPDLLNLGPTVELAPVGFLLSVEGGPRRRLSAVSRCDDTAMSASTSRRMFSSSDWSAISNRFLCRSPNSIKEYPNADMVSLGDGIGNARALDQQGQFSLDRRTGQMGIDAIVALAFQPPLQIVEGRRDARSRDLEGAFDRVRGIAHRRQLTCKPSIRDIEKPASLDLVEDGERSIFASASASARQQTSTLEGIFGARESVLYARRSTLGGDR